MSHMYHLLGDIEGVFIYVDDIIIATEEEKHSEVVKEVMRRLKEANFRLNWDKCKFETREVRYLGYEIRPGKVRPLKEKLAAIKDWEAPRNLKGLQRFLGFSNFQRNHTPNFSRIAAPLNALTSNRKFTW